VISVGVVAGYLLIFIARVADVTLGTLRVLMVVRGRRLQAAIIGFFEVSIFLGALSMVVRNLDDPWKVLAYALGFATGNVLGSLIEEKLAMGFQTVQIISKRDDVNLAGTLRAAGFGVTELAGVGREGPRNVLLVTLERKAMPQLLQLVEDQDEGCFFTVLETRQIHGGVFRYRKGK
jgi:uncharacterized protein YebE (UPF0316 family)